MKVLKIVLNWFVFIFSHNGEIAGDAVNNGLIDHSGQGRNKLGK